ncbi:MAG: ankyrin repeat domain-containing protein, partial [Endomicrobiaceae bacterium]
MKKMQILLFICLFSVPFFCKTVFSASSGNAVLNKNKTVKNSNNIKTNKNLLLALDAAGKGDLKTVKYLIEQQNVDVNAVSGDGITILMKACCNTNTDLVEYLLDNDANFFLKDKFGYTALMYAIEKSDLITVTYLFDEHYSDIQQQIDNQMKFFLLALKNPDSRIIQYLIDVQQFDSSQVTDKGETLLMLAAATGNMDTVKYLLNDAGLDENQKDNNGDTVLMYAVKSKNLDLVQY